jgi:hypothetical protein
MDRSSQEAYFARIAAILYQSRVTIERSRQSILQSQEAVAVSKSLMDNQQNFGADYRETMPFGVVPTGDRRLRLNR